MKTTRNLHLFTLLVLALLLLSCNRLTAQNTSLKIVFMRHGERPDNGENLDCQGLNRSTLLPAVLFRKFGRPSAIYVPSPKLGEITRRGRMFQTITPFAVKYGLSINTAFEVDDVRHLAKALLGETGTVFIVWEHKNIIPVIAALGYDINGLKWKSDDFDTLLIMTFFRGKPVLIRDHEGLTPPEGCAF